MNLSLRTLTIALATSAAIAIGQEVDNPGGPGAVPAAAVEKAKEVVAAVQDVNAAGAAAVAPEVAAADAAEVAAAPEVAAADAAEGGAKAEIAAADAAEVAADAEVAAATADVPDTEEELEGVTVTSGEDPDKITVSLDAVELEDVVRLFTRLSGANIICNTTNLHGTVTANLADIDWKPAFKAIIRQQGLALMEDPLNPEVYEIGVPPPPGKEPLVSKTFKLNYLKASEAATILRNFLGLDNTVGGKPQGAKRTQTRDKDGRVIEEVEAIANEQKGYVVAHPAANTVIVSCRGEDKMREVEKVLADLDVVRQQVFIEAKIVQLSGAASQKIGIDWGFLDGYTISAGSLIRQYTKTKSSLKKNGRSSETTDSAEEKRERTSQSNSLYDRDTNREKIRGIDEYATDVANGDRYTHEDEKNYDMETGTLHRQHKSESTVLSSSSILSTIANTANSSKENSTEVTDVRSAVFNADALSLMVSALQTSDDVSQISNPRLIVANEERAVIDMTKKIPYVTVDMKQDGTGTESTYSYTTKMENIPLPTGTDKDGKALPTPAYIDGAFFSEGIRVDVTPRINNASNITVVIEPMLSHVYDYYMPAGETGTRYPILNIRNVNTVFSLGDGQTAVIGGLTQTDDYDVVKKIPLLGDIPWIGKYLFSWSSKEKKQTEIIIFVTVGIVTPENKENNDTMMSYPDGARLVQKRIDENGKIIDKRMRELETKEERREADRREAEAKGLVVPEAVETPKQKLEADLREAEAQGLVVPEVVEE